MMIDLGFCVGKFNTANTNEDQEDLLLSRMKKECNTGCCFESHHPIFETIHLIEGTNIDKDPM